MKDLRVHICVWLAGIGYYLGQEGKPRPRLWFDIPWASAVVLTGHQMERGSRALHVWLVGVVLFIGGFFLHFPSVVLGEYEIPKWGAHDEVRIAARRLKMVAQIVAAAGFFLMAICQVLGLIRRK